MFKVNNKDDVFSLFFFLCSTFLVFHFLSFSSVFYCIRLLPLSPSVSVFVCLLLSFFACLKLYSPYSSLYLFTHMCYIIIITIIIIIIIIIIITIIITIIFLHASSPYSNAGIRQVSYSLSLILISSSNTWCFAPIALIYLVITSHFLFNSSI